MTLDVCLEEDGDDQCDGDCRAHQDCALGGLTESTLVTNCSSANEHQKANHAGRVLLDVHTISFRDRTPITETPEWLRLLACAVEFRQRIRTWSSPTGNCVLDA
jgi:hypothetical protein